MRIVLHGFVAITALLGVVTWAQSGDREGHGELLREVTDLRAETAHGKPILVEFALTGCPYCRVAEEEFLEPMIRSGAYEDKVLIRRLRMDRGNTVVDLDGREITAADLARRYGATLAPTVVVLDPNNGELLADPVVGLKTVDFYGGYLDRAIEQAVDAMAAHGEAELAVLD